MNNWGITEDLRGNHIMIKNNNCTKYYSNKQEQHIEKALNGKTVSGSGCGKFYKGDVLTKTFLIEAKTSLKDKKSFSVKYFSLTTLLKKTSHG